jgi:hypothetical protein
LCARQRTLRGAQLARPPRLHSAHCRRRAQARLRALRAIAEAIGRGLALPAKSLSPEGAQELLGFIGQLMALDNPTSSARTRELLGWTPTHADLLTDIAEGHYFRTK